MLNTCRLSSGQNEAIRFRRQLSDWVNRVHCRYALKQRKPLKTIEPLVKGSDRLLPALINAAIIDLQLGLSEVELQRQNHQANSQCNSARKLRESHYDQVRQLRLKGEVEEVKASNSIQIKRTKAK